MDDMLSMADVTQTSHQRMHEKSPGRLCMSMCVSSESRSRISVLRMSSCTTDICTSKRRGAAQSGEGRGAHSGRFNVKR